MAVSYTSDLMRVGYHANKDPSWHTVMNTTIQLLAAGISGYSSKAMADANVTLTSTDGAADESRPRVLKFTGANTAIRTVTLPAKTGWWIIWNATTGGFAISVKVSGSSGSVSVANGEKAIVFSDGTDAYLLSYSLTTGFSNPMTTLGDLIYGATGGAATRKAIGTNGHYLRATGGIPAWGALPSAATGTSGIVALAPSSALAAGTDSTKAVTMAALSSDKNKASVGHYVLPGGLLLNWGSASVSGGSTQAVTFSKAYTTCYQVIASKAGTGVDDSSDAWAQSFTTTAVTLKNEASDAMVVRFFAIGIV